MSFDLYKLSSLTILSLSSQMQYQSQEAPQQYLDLNQHRYISNICRNGPIPMSRHKCTDLICTIIFILTILSFLITFSINFFNFQSLSTNRDYDPADLPYVDTIVYLLQKNIPYQAFITLVLMAIGMVLFLGIICIPVITGYLIIILSYVLLVGMLYLQVFAHWGSTYAKIDQFQLVKWDDRIISLDWFRIVLIIITIIAIVLLTFIIYGRLNKIKHLGALMKVNSAILKDNLPFFPLVMIIVFSCLNLALWILLTMALWNIIQIKYQIEEAPVPQYIVSILCIISWMWIHGFQVSLSDYFCQSWIIHWYYSQIVMKQNNDEQKRSWKKDIITKIFSYHFGTILFGSFFAYYPQNLFRTLRKFIYSKGSIKSQHNLLFRMTRYYHIENIMQCLNFTKATSQMYFLRTRIKNKIPQIYMLGHFIQDVFKLAFLMLSIFSTFYFTFLQSTILPQLKAEITYYQFLTFLAVCAFSLGLQIGNNISHLFGMVSDTAVILYSIDCEIQRVYYGSNHARAVPEKLLQHYIQLFTQNIKTKSNETKFAYDEKPDENIRKKSTLYRYSALNGHMSGAQKDFYQHIKNPYDN